MEIYINLSLLALPCFPNDANQDCHVFFTIRAGGARFGLRASGTRLGLRATLTDFTGWARDRFGTNRSLYYQIRADVGFWALLAGFTCWTGRYFWTNQRLRLGVWHEDQYQDNSTKSAGQNIQKRQVEDIEVTISSSHLPFLGGDVQSIDQLTHTKCLLFEDHVFFFALN